MESIISSEMKWQKQAFHVYVVYWVSVAFQIFKKLDLSKKKSRNLKIGKDYFREEE